jgi:uncharacterized Ntn-hydrolase superfamily protein
MAHHRSAIQGGSRIIALTLAAAGAIAPLSTPAGAIEPTGTFSIVARDSLTGELGVAVHSRAFAVASRVAWAQAGVGAVATQASTNESFGPRGLELLAAGLDAGEALAHLLAHDAQPENRQLAIIDAAGNVAAHTGEQCLDWAGHRLGVDVSCQGNILASAAVVDTMLHAFEHADGELARRLLAALAAAQAAGGDRRGVQAAGIIVTRPSARFPEYHTRYVDLRVEDHTDPIGELMRVFEMHETTELVQAHLRFAEDYDAARRPTMARHERERVGQTLARVLAKGEADAETLNGLAWYTALAEVYLDEALVAAQRAVEMAPDSAQIVDTLAEVHFRRGEIDEAITTAARALALEPDSVYLREQLERFERAKREDL